MKTSTTKKVTNINTKILNFIEDCMPKNELQNTHNHISSRVIGGIFKQVCNIRSRGQIVEELYSKYITVFELNF